MKWLTKVNLVGANAPTFFVVHKILIDKTLLKDCIN